MSMALGGPLRLEVTPLVKLLFTKGGLTTIMALNAGLMFGKRSFRAACPAREIKIFL